MTSVAPKAAPLHILLTNSSTIYGGGEFYVLQLARALQRRGHSVWISCRPDNLLLAKCQAEGISTFPLDFPPQGQFFKFVWSLTKVLRENKIQIIHSNANYDRTVSAFAARMMGCAHITNVHSFHSIQHNITHWIRNHLATDYYLVDGECVKDLLRREDRISHSKISVVYLGVEPDSMRRSESLRQKIRMLFGFTETDVVIGNVARLVPFKGHAVLLRAFAEIAPRFPHAWLLLVGDGELSNELHALARELGILHQTIFAGFRDDLQAMYSAFDIYVHSSLEGGGETFPFAVLQALAQELPVVVTKVGDVPAMVQESINGYIVPENNPSALAEKLSFLLSERHRRRAMGEESLKFLLQRFTLDKMVDPIEQVYREVIKRRE